MKLDRFARHKLTFGPTPIEKLPRLSAELGGKVEIFAKRDDCNSGLAFGGNKVRKLEYLVPEALAQGCDTLVTIGGIQSNHTRQVAAVAAKLGMKCRLVQESWVDWNDAVYDRVGNILLSRILGAEVELVEQGFGIGFKESWERALDQVRAGGGKPYAIPAGASDHRLGGLGFVGFAEEVRAQEKELGLRFDYIFVCSVTGSTQAGMVVGFAADGRADRVIGIDGSAKPVETRAQVLKIARATADLVELGRPIGEGDVVLDTPLCLPRLWHALGGDARRHPALGADRRHAHRPRLRGEIDAGHDRHDPERRDTGRLEGALCPSRRRAGDQRLQHPLPERLIRE